jgi:hypothetical protein
VPERCRPDDIPDDRSPAIEPLSAKNGELQNCDKTTEKD